MRILVIGGRGYLGARLVPKLAQYNHQVVDFDITTPSITPRTEVSSNIISVQGDITQIDEIISAICDNKIDRIVHLAYLKTVEAEYQLQRAIRCNVVGTNNVFEACRIAGVARIIYVSSIGYYGLQSSFGERPVTEADRAFPVNVYGYTKSLNEYMAERYAAIYNLKPVCLRLAVAFGAGRKGVGNIWPSNFASNPALGQPARMPKDPEKKYCVIYVDDAVDILCALLLKDNLDHRVYLSGGHTVSTGELAKIVKGFIPEASFEFDGIEGNHQYVYLLDNSRLRDELHIELTPLEEGVLKHINEARKTAGLPELHRT